MASSSIRSTLGLMMFFTAGTLAASGPYTIRYYGVPSGNVHCCARSISCRNVPQLDCCESPPSPSSFPEVYVNSGGQPGIVSFHETDAGGECLGCSNTGSINTCITNVPFEPVAVLDPNSALCSTTANDYPNKRSVPQIKTPIIEGTGGNASVPAVCNRLNAVGIAGIDYEIPEEGRDEFMKDFIDMSDEELISKWALIPHEDQGDLAKRQTSC